MIVDKRLPFKHCLCIAPFHYCAPEIQGVVDYCENRHGSLSKGVALILKGRLFHRWCAAIDKTWSLQSHLEYGMWSFSTALFKWRLRHGYICNTVRKLPTDNHLSRYPGSTFWALAAIFNYTQPCIAKKCYQSPKSQPQLLSRHL